MLDLIDFSLKSLEKDVDAYLLRDTLGCHDGSWGLAVRAELSDKRNLILLSILGALSKHELEKASEGKLANTELMRELCAYIETRFVPRSCSEIEQLFMEVTEWFIILMEECK